MNTRGCQHGQGLCGRAGYEPAVEGDLARSKAEAVQLGNGLVEELVLARVAGCGRRRQQVPAGAAAGVGGDLGQLGDVWAASARASRIERASACPAWAFSARTSPVRWPVRRARVLEILRTSLPIRRDRSTTAGSGCAAGQPAGGPRGPSARAPCKASTPSG
jgi:hypothetical protein